MSAPPIPAVPSPFPKPLQAGSPHASGLCLLVKASTREGTLSVSLGKQRPGIWENWWVCAQHLTPPASRGFWSTPQNLRTAPKSAWPTGTSHWGRGSSLSNHRRCPVAPRKHMFSPVTLPGSPSQIRVWDTPHAAPRST